MTSLTLYEHPLNEQVRIYLRLEYLLDQLDEVSGLSAPCHHIQFFRSLFDLLEILEQVQVKADLAKDLDKLKKKLNAWAHVPQVDQQQLQQLLEQLAEHQRAVLQAKRFGQALREDRFLTSIKQRFSIPGGSCSFDLPIFHHWLHQPLAARQNAINGWLATLSPLRHALAFWLQLTRESAQGGHVEVKQGFYQQDADGACLIRIQVNPDLGVYPLVSGHKNRFAIRFMPFDDDREVADNMPVFISVC
ncbi:cell division protein ZapD [Salinivibrio costicola]|uniref:Cell division protein ZapD n=1 Tax=Salinivibrio costicola TaxID=51367 RepID=A0ABX6K1G4_SALCS|nr:cell division protein ZapD [Salinivibrio costicola]QIR05314.1 cell division protein ZapD [Salinivibrio costicola]